MVKLDPLKLIKELNLDKNTLFKYLEQHTIKECKKFFGIKTQNQFYCIVNYWGGYKTPAEKRKLISIENGKKSVCTHEKLLKSKLNGSRGYELLDDVLQRIDYEEFINDYNTPMSKKELAKKYMCTLKMIQKVINHYCLHVTKENFCLLSGSKTIESKNKQKNNYKKTMQKLYGVDNYFQTDECKSKIQKTCVERYGVAHYSQSKEFRENFFSKFKSYYCDGEHFDSSWELILWVYARDHNQKIKREPIQLKYKHKGVDHTYYPDFLYENNLIEIKGDHMLDENKKLKAIYADNNQELLNSKQKCIDDNGVIIMTYEDLKFAFDYFNKMNYKVEDFKTKNE